jgi:adenine-specific DNA glycosylase
MAWGSGDPTAYPPPRRRAARRQERHVVVVVERGARVLLVRRDAGAELLAGLWELPWVDAGEDDLCAALGRRYGGRWRIGAPLARVRHAITVRDLELLVCRGSVELGEAVAEGRETGFFDDRQRRALGTSSMVDKALAAVAQGAADAQQRLPLEATRLR